MVKAAEALKPWEEGFSLPQRFNMVSLLLERHLATETRHAVAVIQGSQAWTYSQLAGMANRFGSGLAGLGVEPGQRVILVLDDGPVFMAAFLGAMKTGAVPVPVNVMATPEDLAYFAADSGAGAMVAESAYLDKLGPAMERCPDLKRIIIHGPSSGENQPGGPEIIDWAALLDRSSPELEVHPTSPLDHSYWLYTSGTTGQPKGVVHLHRDLVYAVETWGRHVLDFQPTDRVHCVSKLFFSYGLNNGLYLPLYYGASVVLVADRPLPETVLETIARYRPTVLFSVPTSYGQILNHLEARGDKADLSSLRACISAGEALPGPILRRWQERFGLEILDGLGSSEVSFIYISNRPGQARPDSSGLLLPGYKAEIRDEEGRALPPGEVGELWVRSLSITRGYWNKPDKTAETFHNGWMKTGDRCHRDGEGYFFYSGRADDALKVSGIWVSPLEVEAALLDHPAVAEAAVVPRRDGMGLIKPQAFVVPKPGPAVDDALASELKNFVKGRIAPYKYPRWIEFVTDLPKTSTGKIQRYRLRLNQD